MTEAFDQDELMEELEGDIEFLQESLETLQNESPDLLRSIRDALLQSDASGIQAAAHTLKGMVSNFCAVPAFEAAARLEAIAKDAHLHLAADQLTLLEFEIERLRESLQQFVTSQDA